MAGDYSRSSFDPSKHNSGVRMQQGRVQLDSDWNEQVDIVTHFARAATSDAFGPYGAPANNAGFAISVQGGALVAGPGRMYVNGVLCENAGNVAVVAGWTVPPQPDLPGYALPTVAGTYLLYLDVFEREITALDDRALLEVALAGVDTTTRTRVVWQIKWTAWTGDGGVNLASQFPASTGALQARAQPDASVPTPYAVPAEAGYTSLENQLYRIEIHTAGTGGAATFKWSRDNGSVAASWLSQPSANQLVVSTLGRDQALGFAAGQWVELIDNSHLLNNQPGQLVQLTQAAVLAGAPTLTFAGSANMANFPENPLVRRWDETAAGGALAADNAVALQEGQWLTLENGVQVMFSPGGKYNTGDYWLIPARTATVLSSSSVIWPTGAGGAPLPQPALGPAHYYAPLACVALKGANNWSVLADCRWVFSPASTRKPLHVTSLQTLQPAGELANDSLLPVATFLNGVKVVCDGALNPAAIKLSTFFVTLDLPVATSPVTGTYPAAAQVKLMANVTVGDAGDVSAVWTPTAQTRTYVYEQLATFAAQTMNQAEAMVAVTLRGGAINGASPSASVVDGAAFANASNNGVTLALPSGVGARGSDFNGWFWVPGYTDPTFPHGFVPFVNVTSTSGPDSSGDSVIVGDMTQGNFIVMLNLAQSDVTARKIYSQPVAVAPGVLVYLYVPSKAERAGDFSGFGAPLVNPATNQPFANNQVPSLAGSPGGGVFAWRIRAHYTPPSGYGYGYGGGGVGSELI